MKVAQAFRIKKSDLREEFQVNEPKPKVKFDPFEEVKEDKEFKEFLKVQRNIGM